MKQLRAADYLQHMQEAAQLACGYVEGMDKQGFLTDRRTQQAVIMNLIILGEAATKLVQTAHDFLRIHPEVNGKSFKTCATAWPTAIFPSIWI